MSIDDKYFWGVYVSFCCWSLTYRGTTGTQHGATPLLPQQTTRTCSTMFQYPSPTHVKLMIPLSLAPYGQGCSVCMACSWASPVQVHSLHMVLACMWGALLLCEACLHTGCASACLTRTSWTWGKLACGVYVYMGYTHVWGALVHGVHGSHIGQAGMWVHHWQ